MQTIQQYLNEKGLELSGFLDTAWKWRYGTRCMSNKIELDTSLCRSNPKAMPEYARLYYDNVIRPDLTLRYRQGLLQ